MMSYLSSARVIAYYILQPLLLMLKSILTILLFLAAPLVHLGHFVVHFCSWPFHFLAKFEVDTRALSRASQLLTVIKDIVHLFRRRNAIGNFDRNKSSLCVRFYGVRSKHRGSPRRKSSRLVGISCREAEKRREEGPVIYEAQN